MPVLIEIQDSSSPLAKILVPQNAPTLRDRIHHEVTTHNQHLPELFTGLVLAGDRQINDLDAPLIGG